jgi:hypothetical protein
MTIRGDDVEVPWTEETRGKTTWGLRGSRLPH